MPCSGLSFAPLSRNVVNNCQPNAPGIKEQIYVGTLDQISAVVYNTTEPQFIDSFTLKGSEKLKLWEGYSLSQGFTVGLTVADTGNKTPHGLRFTVFENSAAADKEINKIVRRKDLFAFAKQNGQFGRWVALGFTTGLSATTLTLDSNNTDNPGQYIIEFSAPNETETPKTLLHKTSALDDTEDYLKTFIVAPV